MAAENREIIVTIAEDAAPGIPSMENHEMTINDYMLDQYAASIADEILRECDGDRDHAMDLAHQHADGSEWAIYYSKAHELCENCNTDNGEQFYEDCGPWDDITYDKIATIIAYGELRARIERAIEEKIIEMEAA